MDQILKIPYLQGLNIHKSLKLINTISLLQTL